MKVEFEREWVAQVDDWNGRQVLIVGAARQGIALARYLARQGAQVTITDRRPAEELQSAQEALAGSPVAWSVGGHPLNLLDRADLLCISGGVPLTLPLVLEAQRRGIPLSNDSQIFLASAPCPVIGITGSAGKSTTTTLVGRIANDAAEAGWRPLNGKQVHTESSTRVWVGGNIGSPLIAFVDEMKHDDLAVMELSSFQLEIMTRSPQVAAVLNITPNHLDRHANMEAYTRAKARILEFQRPQDLAVLGRDDAGAWSLAGRARGRLVSFGLGPLPPGQTGTYLDRGGQAIILRRNQEGADREFELLSRREISLRGEHNLLNVLAAGAIACAAGLPVEAVRSGVVGFSGMPHRLEFIRSWGGADWYNDSIATAPERSMAAIQSFEEPLVLLAGGRDKNLPWEDFAELVNRRVKYLILFGEAAGKIERAIQAVTGRAGAKILRCSSLEEAVQEAARVVIPGDVVLLSPGGTSFDEFRDFEDRGEVYRKWVAELPS